MMCIATYTNGFDASYIIAQGVDLNECQAYIDARLNAMRARTKKPISLIGLYEVIRSD